MPPWHVPAITFSDDGPCAQLNAASMFRIRRRCPKSNRSVPTIAAKRGGGVTRWTAPTVERSAHARVVWKSYGEKIFVKILLSLSRDFFFTVEFPVTRAASRKQDLWRSTPGAVCVLRDDARPSTKRSRTEIFTNFLLLLFVWCSNDSTAGGTVR